MSVPIFVQQSVGTTDAGGTWSHTANAPTAAGRILIVQVLQDGTSASNATITSVTNAEALDGTDNTLTYIGEFNVGSGPSASQHLWIGRSLNTSAMVITGGNAGTDDLYIRVYEFAECSLGATLGTVIENVTAGATVNSAGTSATIADASVTTIGPDRLPLNFVAGNDDNPIDSFAGMTGGMWAEINAEYIETVGTDGVIQLQIGGSYAVDGDDSAAFSDIFGNTGTTEAQAGSFVTGSAAVSSFGIAVSIRKTGSPADSLNISIQGDSGDAPDGTALATATIAGSALSTTGNRYPFSFALALSASTKYWVVYERTGARDTSNFFETELGQLIHSGRAATRDSGTWSAGGTQDMSFTLCSGLASAGTIGGGTDAWADATDSWGVVGFALIGTTVDAPPRHPAINHQDPALLMQGWRRSLSGLWRRPELWTPDGALVA